MVDSCISACFMHKADFGVVECLGQDYFSWEIINCGLRGRLGLNLFEQRVEF